MVSSSRFFFIISIIFLNILFCNCNFEIHGQFGWSNRDNRGIGKAEKNLFIENVFRIERENLYFLSHETIWWIYQITDGIYFSENFLAALYTNNSTPQPFLTDLREAELLESGCCKYIRHYYEGLKPGRYLLRIAYDSETIDKVHFAVLPSTQNDELPFSHSKSEEKTHQNLGLGGAEESVDEIKYYSHSIFHKYNKIAQ